MLIVGSVAYDGIETHMGSVPRVLGGSATYASVAASFFCPVRLVGVVGDDFRGEDVDYLRSRGINLDGLERRTGKTFYWRGRYSDDFSRRETLATELNVFAEFAPELPDVYRDSRDVLLANIAPDLQLRVLAQAASAEFVVADTMNLWIDTQRATLLDMLQRVDVLLINEEEAPMLSGLSDLREAAGRLLTFGPSRAIIKLGANGAFSLTDDAFFELGAYPVAKVVDPTGAGDVFAGAMAGYLASQSDRSEDTVRRALLYSAAIASFAVEDFGLDRLRAVDEQAVEERYAALADSHAA